MKIRLADDNILTDSIVDGEGLRAVIWTQGCSHNCKGCHNPETHDFTKGILKDIEEVKDEIKNLKLQDGITLSGGDPFFQAKACTEIAKFAKKQGLNVWAYTGFLFEDLLKVEDAKELLKYIDVLVDGKFELENKSLNIKFRGSTNQRIINVPKSLKDGKVRIIKKYDMKKKKTGKTLFV
ncbi:MAG: anaerobic ribonucleoside-triphosphate reductase activating protein [Bacilli bacterium]